MERTNEDMQQRSVLSPLDSGERLNHIDSIRGLALLGILIVNMLAFQYGKYGYQFALPDLSWYDRAFYIGIEWLFVGSFYPVFSILFGFGAVMMWERANMKGEPAFFVFFRRMLMLLILGFIHMYFIWDGDILLTYAMTGLVFLFFLKRSPKTMAVWIVILGILVNSMSVSGDNEGEVDFSTYVKIEEKVLSEGAYRDVVSLRWTVNPFEKVDFGTAMTKGEHQVVSHVITFLNHVVLITQALLLFLLGGMIAKKRWLHQVKEHHQFLLRAAVVCFVIGLTLKGGMVLTENSWLEGYGYLIGGPVLGLGYIAAFALLYNRFKSHRLLEAFRYSGRMALTNYLAQSLVMTTIFYGYGLGLFASVGIMFGTLLALTFFVIQIMISRWWLSRFRYGPMEWIWRAATYLRLPTLKR